MPGTGPGGFTSSSIKFGKLLLVSLEIYFEVIYLGVFHFIFEISSCFKVIIQQDNFIKFHCILLKKLNIVPPV